MFMSISASPTLFLSFLALILLSKASATSLAYPVRDQYPLIARIGQQYSWSISSQTFATSNPANLTITASGLPPWLSFSNGQFSGTPSASDEGSFNVTLLADGVQDSFSLCVTHFPPPTANISLESQFYKENPSMSSVYPIGAGSALHSDNPSLRVPLRWSFSIGFQPATFVNPMDLFYYAQLANGSRLPNWLRFDSKAATFDGVAHTPPLHDGEKVELVLIASDQEGYSAIRAPFDLFIATHDLSMTKSFLLNLTKGEEFKLDLRQNPWFFEDITVDNATFQVENMTSLSIDTSSATWWTYDPSSFTFSGMAPSQGTFPVPMTLHAFNQTLPMNTMVNLVPSYFKDPVLPGTSVNPGADVALPLSQYFSANSYFINHDVVLTANSSAGLNVTKGEDGGHVLTGHIPNDHGSSHIDVQFEANDHTAHVVSRAVLRLSYRTPSSDAKAQDALAKHRRLVLGLSIGLGGTAALLLVAGALALVRKHCRVKDTARGPFSPEEKGGELPVPDMEGGGGYGWSEKAGLGLSDGQSGNRPKYKGVGIGFTPSLVPGSPPPKRMMKAAFFQNVKTVVRKFSSGHGTGSTRKSAISRPVLMFTKDSTDNMRALRAAAGLDESGYADSAPDSLDVPPGDGISLGLSSSSPTSTNGHSLETGNVSIPRQRPDFGPARTGQHGRARSVSQAQQSSVARKASHSRRRSMDTDRDRDAELAEAVIVTASRATSLRSARSSAYSYDPSSYTRDSAQVARPRLVPFTARGMPVPVPTLGGTAGPVGPRDQRRVSQIAAVVSPDTGKGQDSDTDAIMTDGLRYVRAFGDQNAEFEPPVPPNLGPVPTGLTSKRSSRSHDGVSSTQTQSSYVFPSPSQSIESSVKRGGDGASRGSRGSRGSLMMSRILVRTGEAFAFKYPIALASTPNSSSGHKLVARLLYGGTPLPAFLSHVVSNATPSLASLGSNSKKRRMRYEVEFWGTPSAKDVGEVVVGIFTEGGNAECVGRLVVEVVPRGG